MTITAYGPLTTPKIGLMSIEYDIWHLVSVKLNLKPQFEIFFANEKFLYKINVLSIF